MVKTLQERLNDQDIAGYDDSVVQGTESQIGKSSKQKSTSIADNISQNNMILQ